LVHYSTGTGTFPAAENVTTAVLNGDSDAGTHIIDGLTAVIGPEGTAQHVFGKNAKGELVHYYWNAQAGWVAEDLTNYPYTGRAYTFN
jgi:hypothetical protein